jgi:anaerobic selenocysteine-containing dehydrogenase
MSAVVHSSACPMDCPDTCRLAVTVEDGRVTKVDGDARDPFTDGFICGKVRAYPEHMYGGDRILHPMVRAGAKGSGQFRQISWDEALQLTVDRMRETIARSGPEAILPYAYGGSNGALTDGGADWRLFRRLGATRMMRTFCAAATTAAATGLYGRMPGVALEDYVHAKLIIVWGCNPSATSIHLVPIVKEARARGAKLVVIDPRRIPLARQADVHLQLRAGTDVPVALALINWLFDHGKADTAFLAAHASGVDELRRRARNWPIERAATVAGIPAADLEAVAQLYAETNPAVIRCGWGIERNRNGAHSVAAVLAIAAVGGKFGVRGGGYTMSQGRAYGLAPASVVAADEPPSRLINMCQLGEELLERRDPRIELLFVYNANPAVTAPAQAKVLEGLAREDLFTIVHEQVMTDTARYADLILPATTFLEHRELKAAYGAIRLYDSPPVVAPVGEARPNYELFVDLADRLGLSQPGDARTTDEMVDRMVGGAARDGERMRSELRAEGVAVPPTGHRPVQFVDVFPLTASGKIELVPESLDSAADTGLYGFRPLPGSERYPLQLLSPANTLAISSSFYQLVDHPAELHIHPEAARARGIVDGASIRVWNDQAEVVCLAKLDAGQRDDVVVLPKGLWRKHTANGLTAAALAPDHVTDIGGQGCFNDAFVQVALVVA